MRDFYKRTAKGFTPPAQTRGGNKTFIDKPQETPLTGEVQGLKAAQGEERFSRTLNKGMAKRLVRGYYFRTSPGLPKGVQGWKELDYLVFGSHDIKAISIKGTGFVHHGESAKAQDRLNELIILARLAAQGIKLDKIISVPAESLVDQEQSDKIGRSLGVYR
jgi:hypothetical protein